MFIKLVNYKINPIITFWPPGSGVPGKRVGYMPQEIALYGEFTIKETMMYFGWIFGMETREIVERLRFLLDFLDLPSENRMVKNLR